jgi:MraZ protein
VQHEHFFGGSALRAVDDRGRVRLPNFVRKTLERRTDDRTIVLGPHDSDSCLTAYDRGHKKLLFADTERLRLRDEASAAKASAAHHARARRTFGITEEAGFDGEGRVALPEMMRRLGRIGSLALFVGTGSAFEIWNPHLAAENGDPALSELARYRLENDDPTNDKEE